MQIRSKAYLHFISLWRSLRDAIPPHRGDMPAEASPFLIYTAIVLASLLAILEVDVHRDELGSLGLLGGNCFIQSAFLGP
jgi:hypothetical protein